MLPKLKKMQANQILEEIARLPMAKRLYVVEKTMSLIRRASEKDEMKAAAELLYSEYIGDEELTIFTGLDLEDFYEAR